MRFIVNKVKIYVNIPYLTRENSFVEDSINQGIFYLKDILPLKPILKYFIYKNHLRKETRLFSDDDFENYESLFWKPYVEKSIIKGKHRYWGLSKVYERADNAYEGMTHFFFNVMVEGGSMTSDIPTDSFKFQKLQEGLNAASQHADPITLELVSRRN